MGRLTLFFAIAGCYAPRIAPGSLCNPGDCPAGMLCSDVTHVCEAIDASSQLGDAAGASGSDAATAAWLTGYSHRKPVTITPGTSTTLTDFPVSVFEPSDPDLAGVARSNGKDIVFTAADAVTVLPSELVAYAPNTGSVDAWVRTSLSAGASTVLYMYYGGPVATSAGTAWSSMFAGVWHMDGSTMTATDTSGNAHDASAPTTAQAPTLVTGIAGIARNYDGVDDTLSAGDPADGSLDFGASSFSYSVWVLVTSSAGLYDHPLHKGGSAPDTPGYDFELGTGVWHSGTADGTSLSTGDLGIETDHLTSWTQLTAVIDRSTGKLLTYVNGTLKSSTATSITSVDNAIPLTLGRDTAFFRGVLDEVRIYKAALSASWIAAEYKNLAARGQFLSIGPAQTR